MEKKSGQQILAVPKTQLVEQINSCLHSGDYSRALNLLRDAAAEFPNDPELSELEKLAQDGVKRKAEADRLITESQELFAQQKSAEALQLLRKAYELDKNNSLTRSILANALVEHARSIVETDWLEAEKLTNQALNLTPAHPTAKTILNLILDRKKTSSVEDWVSQARKLQSAGDLFAALAWVAEGLDIHAHDPKLLQIQDAIQRDQDTRRRQARRGDLEDLRRMQREIDGAADVAAKQALAVRIQTVAAKYWTDGEILSIANALLLRLGLVSQESSGTSPRGKGGTVILHVPRPSAPKPSGADSSQIAAPPRGPLPGTVMSSPVPPPPVPPSPVSATPVSATPIPPVPVLPSTTPPTSAPPASVTSAPVSLGNVPPRPVLPENALPENVPSATAPPSNISTGIVPASIVPPSEVPQSEATPSKVPAGTVPLRRTPRGKVRTTPQEPKLAPPQSTIFSSSELSVRAVRVASASSDPQPPTKSNSTMLIIVSAATAAIFAVAATLFFTRRHYAPPVANSSTAAPVIASSASAPAASAPDSSGAPTTPEQATTESSPPASNPSSDSAAAKVAPDNQLPAESNHDVGTLLVVAGQDNAKVFLNGKLQRQLTQAGQLRIQNLELKDYVVQVAKSGFQDLPQQQIRIRKGEQARLVFNLQPQPQPQPRMASLTIQGGTPGSAVFVDQASVGTIQPDGTLSVSNVNPGDHIVELRKDRFKPRQLKEHFVAGGSVSLAAADATLEAIPGELKITFAPADAKVAIVKGEHLTMVSSGVPLNLAAGTYTLTARTADRFTRSSTIEVVGGQSKTLNLSLAPNDMSKWDNPGAWKQEKDSFVRKGGDFVLYSVAPTSGTFVFSAMPAKGHLLQWVLNYTDAKNYVLFQMDDDNFYRAVIRNGAKTDEIKVPDKSDKKSFRTFHIRVSPTEIVHEIKNGDSWTAVDRWTQPGANLGQGKFGFYIPGNDQVAISSFTHYADLNIR